MDSRGRGLVGSVRLSAHGGSCALHTKGESLNSSWITRFSVLPIFVVLALVGSLLVLVDAVATRPADAATDPEPVSEVADAAAAMAAAQAQDQRVEVLDARTESSLTFANPDGSFTTEASTVPERVQQADGSWVDVDTTLVRDGDSWVPRAAAEAVSFSDGGGVPFADVQFDGGQRLALKWPGGLPEPVVTGSTLTYPDAVPGGDLVVTALPSGFSHSVVLHERPAPGLELSVPLVLRDTEVTQSGTDALVVRDEDGDRLLTAPQPLMWDATTDAGEPASVVAVESVLDLSGARPELVLTPDADVLADSATEYPVTIDPTYTASGDAWVQNADYTTGQVGSTELRAGTYDGGSHKARSFLHFNDGLGVLEGTQILSATFRLRNFYSYSCNSAAIRVSRVTDTWTGQNLTWNNQPGVTGAGSDTFSQAFGYGGACANAGDADWNVKDIVQGWADDSFPNRGLRVKAEDESNSNSWRKYRALAATQGSSPKLIVTYNRYPNKPASLTWSPKSAYGSTDFTTSARPTFSVNVTDPDASQVRAYYEIKQGSTVIDSGNGSWVGSGKTSSWQAAANTLSDGQTYTVKAWARDGDADSKNAVTDTFKVDTTKPAAPTAVTDSVCGGQDFGVSPSNGKSTFTWTASTSADLAGHEYRLDNGAWTALDATQITMKVADGVHTFEVRATDKAGNVSSSATYECVVGTFSMASPTPSVITAGTLAPVDLVPLQAVAEQGSTVRFEYRKGSTGSWAPIPDQALSAAQPFTLAAGSEVYLESPIVDWAVRATEADLRDGLIQVRGCLNPTSGQPCAPGQSTKRVNIRLDATGGGWAPVPAGPGILSLRSGNLYVPGPAGGAGELWVGGFHNSLNAESDGPLGAGWTTTLPSAVYVELQDTGTQLEITDVAGGQHLYELDGSDYVAVGEADDLTIATSGSGDSMSYLVTDAFGSSIRFSRLDSISGVASEANPVSYRVTQVSDPTGTVASAEYDSQGNPTTLFDTDPAGADCEDSWGAGCRKLTIDYDPVTVDGSSVDRITSLQLHLVGNGGSPTVTDVACFTYDSQARLASWWDPRTESATCDPQEPVLPTSYGYDSDDRVVSVTPPGQAAWQYTYDTNDRVATVSRIHGQQYGGGTEVTAFAYDVDLSAASASDDSHPDLSEDAVNEWGQNSVPTYAAAIFPPGAVSTDLREGIVMALDETGEQTNIATFAGEGQSGWQVSSVNYNGDSEPISELTPENRLRALTADGVAKEALGLTASATSGDVAAALSTTYQLDEDGNVTDVFGPLHEVAVPGGSPTPARAHTHFAYGTVDLDREDVPPGFDATENGPEGLVTEQTTAASLSPEANPAAPQVDARTTRYAYGLSSQDLSGWTHYTAVQTTTVVPGGTDIIRENVIDPDTGQTVQVRQPSAAGGSGNGADTTRFVYYTSGTNSTDSACGNKPAWDGLVCTRGPGGQPGVAGLPGLVTARVTDYDPWGRVREVAETVQDASGTPQTRTTSTVFDGPGGVAGRVTTVQVTGTVGRSVPQVTFEYDPVTGLQTTMRADESGGADLAGVLHAEYDDFGNLVKFTDADDAATEYQYDPAGRLETVTYLDPQNATVGTSTYGYGTATDHRGLVSSVTHSGVGGAITANHDADGQIVTQTYPDGLTLWLARDTEGEVTDRTYTKSGFTFLSDNQLSSIHGQWLEESGALLPFQREYSYDAAGRLTTVADTDATGTGAGCTTRSYGFDTNSNRTSKTTYDPATDGTCSTSDGSTSTNYAYDDADRLQPVGQHGALTYDAFGRITTVPATDNDGSSAATVDYFLTDMVASTHQGGNHRNWALDPAMRLRTMTAESGDQVATTNHYSDPVGDAPAWTDDTDSTGTSNISRMLQGPDGSLAAVVTGNDVRWLLAGLHGDIIRTTSPAATAVPDGDAIVSDEYGNTTSSSRYGYLGQAQRARDDLTAMMFMGVRMYAPAMGRFLQTDPQIGGNETTYGYPEDPVNSHDASGQAVEYRYMWTKHRSWLANGFTQEGVCFKQRYEDDDGNPYGKPHCYSGRIKVVANFYTDAYPYGKFVITGGLGGGGYPLVHGCATGLGIGKRCKAIFHPYALTEAGWAVRVRWERPAGETPPWAYFRVKVWRAHLFRCTTKHGCHRW